MSLYSTADGKRTTLGEGIKGNVYGEKLVRGSQDNDASSRQIPATPTQVSCASFSLMPLNHPPLCTSFHPTFLSLRCHSSK